MNKLIFELSLRQRLVLAVVAAFSGILLLLVIAIQAAIARSSAQEFDERLAKLAGVILAYADHEFAETGTVVPETDIPGARGVQEVIYQVWTTNNVAIHRSDGAPGAPLAAHSLRGFGEARIDGTDWRIYALQSHDMPLVVQIAELSSHRHLIAARARKAVMLPLLVSLPLLAGLVWWLTSAALRPLDRLAREIRARSLVDMQPLDERRLPTEIEILVKALNSLISRHGAALVSEQRFTADAAHEMRTPLAAVRAQAQVALRSEEPLERRHALQQLIAGVDRTGRLVTQLLSLARLEPAQVNAAAARRSATDVLQDTLHDLQHDIERHGVVIDVAQPTAKQLVPEEPVYLLLRNLIDNSIRHSPVGGVIRIVFAESAAGLTVIVSDQGPGIPATQREAAFDRFRRFSAGYDGSGLGLSIVKRVAELLDGTVELRDAVPAPGLEVKVTMPRATHLSA